MSYHHRQKATIVSRTTLGVDGVEVQVIRKTVRNMYLRVKPPAGTVEVSTPVRMKDEEIAAFVRGRRAWIERRKEQINDARRRFSQAPRYTQISGHVADDGFGGGGNHGGIESDAVFEWTEANKRLATANINAQLPMLLAHWEPIVGRKPTHITLRLMTTRWGSCTPNTGRIRLNLQLGLMDQRFLEYVLVHEMTHLWVNGHGVEFQRRMDEYLPDWRERRHALNKELVW
jgi:predicted metal-dependent hydrolase